MNFQGLPSSRDFNSNLIVYFKLYLCSIRFLRFIFDVMGVKLELNFKMAR